MSFSSGDDLRRDQNGGDIRKWNYLRRTRWTTVSHQLPHSSQVQAVRDRLRTHLCGLPIRAMEARSHSASASPRSSFKRAIRALDRGLDGEKNR